MRSDRSDRFDWFGNREGAAPRRHRRRVALVIAVLVPACFAGLVAWQSFGDSTQPGRHAHSWASHSATPGRGSASATGRESASPGKDGNGMGNQRLAGRVVVVDPGHNLGNVNHTAEINKTVNAGGMFKECDTTGTATNDGYAEASFTLDVSRRVRKILQREGATVRLTHDGNRPWGPCVDERARIGNEAHADAAISIHADGSAAANRGFHVIVPEPIHTQNADTRAITAPSRRLGELVESRYATATGFKPAKYVGDGSGLVARHDLGGLNLSRVPKVFIECGNMRNAADAQDLTSASWRQRAAEGIAEGIAYFLSQDG